MAIWGQFLPSTHLSLRAEVNTSQPSTTTCTLGSRGLLCISLLTYYMFILLLQISIFQQLPIIKFYLKISYRIVLGSSVKSADYSLQTPNIQQVPSQSLHVCNIIFEFLLKFWYTFYFGSDNDSCHIRSFNILKWLLQRKETTSNTEFTAIYTSYQF